MRSDYRDYPTWSAYQGLSRAAERANARIVELKVALAERDEEMAIIQWIAREAIAATWPDRPSDETIESEYQELLADARRGKKP